MKRPDLRDAVVRFLELLEPTPTEVDEREDALRIALDRLALAYHFADPGLDASDHPAPPRAPYVEVRRRIAPLFPRLGQYNVALEVSDGVGASALGIADAIDDLTRIAIDLQEVVARWETAGADDALFHFKQGFETHWGRHLRELQLCLHDLAFPGRR